MELLSAEKAVLSRYHEKARTAGGAKPGYVMRPQSFQVLRRSNPGLDITSTLDGLIEKGLLVANEARDRYYLTEEGAELLARNPTRFA